MDFSQFPSPRVTLPAYTKVDLSAEFPIPVFSERSVSMNARVENVFDKQYQEVLNYAAPGRTFLLGGRWAAAF
jgi:outer membrane cobalamin receptor